MRVTVKDFEMLPRTREYLLRERNSKIEILQNETAFESRRQELALEKI